MLCCLNAILERGVTVSSRYEICQIYYGFFFTLFYHFRDHEDIMVYFRFIHDNIKGKRTPFQMFCTPSCVEPRGLEIIFSLSKIVSDSDVIMVFTTILQNAK